MSARRTRRWVNLGQVARIKGSADQDRAMIELNVEELEERLAPSLSRWRPPLN